MRILIIEDEKRLAQALEQILMEQKYMVDIANDGQEGYDYAQTDFYDVILLDVMLPKLNGYQVATRLRQQKIKTPILMLTAKDLIPDKVTGLDCGADDYMTKPFSPEELLARIRALSRRQGEVILEEMTFSDLNLNLTTCDLKCNLKSVHLNYKEFEILKLLMANPHSITTKEDLIIKVWGFDSDADDNNVEAYISFLRKKFQFLCTNVGITTLRKIGYRLEETNSC